jgi:hypothetical protein
MTMKFETVKRGLEASVSVRRKIEMDEKQRWQSVLAQVPEHRQKMAVTLLGKAKNLMTDAEIVATCRVGLAPLEGDTSITNNGKQALFAAGLTEAARLLGKPAPTIPEAYSPTAPEFQLDPVLYAAGADMAKSLKPFMMVNAR